MGSFWWRVLHGCRNIVATSDARAVRLYIMLIINVLYLYIGIRVLEGVGGRRGGVRRGDGGE